MRNKLKQGLALLFLCIPALGQNQPEQPNPTENPPAETVTAVGQERAGERNIRFQFDGIPYMDVVERFAQMAKKPLLAETNVQGTVTFNDPRPYTYQEAFETLNTILSMKDVMLVETDRYLRLVPYESLPNMPLKIFRGLDQTGDVSAGEVVTVMMDLQNLEASETAQAVKSMLSPAGSIAPLTQGKGLILTDRLGHIRRIKQLLTELDSRTSSDRQMKAHTIMHASGAVVADLINKTFGEATAPKRTRWNEHKKSFDALPPNPEDYVTAVYDEASRTLLLFGPSERIALAEELIQKFESKEGARGGEVKIFYPRANEAEDLARMIRQAIPGVAAENETGSEAATKARVIVDRDMNRLIVAAPVAGQLDAIENLVNRVERSAGGEGVSGADAETVEITKVIRIESADPAAAFRVITNAFTRRLPNGETIPSLKANLDAQAKTIVITGSPGEVQHALGIVEQMENATPELGPLETIFISFPSSAELERVQPLLQQLYSSQVLNREGGAHAEFIPDTEARRLIVTATPEHLEIIRGIADQLRAPAIASQPREFRALRLQNLKLDQAFKTISDLVKERMSGDLFRDIPEPLLLADSPNNRLLITANAAQFEAIEEIVRAVDIAPDQPEREITSIPLQTLSASEILPSLNQLMRPIAEAHPDPASRPEIIAGADGKTLILSAVPADLERIREIIAELEGGQRENATRQFKTVELYNRTPQEIIPLAEQLYREQLKGQPEPPGGPASFLPEARGSRVIIIGSESELARAENIIRQLNPAIASTGEEETRVVRLRNAIAEDISGLIEKSLNLSSEGVRLLVDERSNSLVLSGDAKTIDAAVSMIEQLDVAPNSEPREIRVFDLKGTDARTAASMLDDLLADSMRVLRGENYELQAKIVPDDDNERLLVTGTPEELREAASLMRQLDQPTGETEGTRVFKLSSSSARELAEVISDAMISYTRGGGRRRTVTVSADEATNSLIVSGPRADLEEAALIIEKLDGGGEGADRQVRIIELKTDEPEELVRLSQQIWDAQTDGRRRDEVTLTLDPTGRRVIIVAPSAVIAQVEQVVTGLDQEPGGAPRSLQIVELSKRSASDLMPTLTRLYEEQSKGGKERPATIVPESSGRRLLVYGSEAQAAAIRELVAQLESGAETAERQTRMFEVGQPEDVQRLLPLVQQLYREQMKDSPASDPADAQILGDERAGRLIVTARPSHLERIERIITKLASGSPEPKDHQTRVYNLKSTTAEDLVQMVRSVYEEEVKRHPSITSPQALILPDPLSNRLIVSGNADELEVIEGIIEKLDQISTQAGNTRTFQLQNAQAEEVASLLSTTLVRQIGYNRSYPRVTVGIDKNNNVLIVSGQPADLAAAATIIEMLDGNAAGSSKLLRIFPVSGNNTEDFAARLRQLYEEQVESQPDFGPADALFLPDIPTGRLIITASERQMPLIEELIRGLDQLAADGERQLRLFTLEHNPASAISSIIREMFSRNLGNTEPAQRLVITPGLNPNTLVAEAPKPILDRVAQLIENVDTPALALRGRETRILNFASTEELERISPLAQQLYREQLRGREATDPADAQFIPDTFGGRLIVTGRTNHLARIEEIIATLRDSEGVPAQPHETRIYNLSTATAEELAETVSSIYEDKLEGNPALATSRALIMPDETANRLIVSGTEAHLEIIEEIVKALDQVSPQTGGTRVFKLKAARAEQIASVLSSALVDYRFGRQIPRVSVGSDTNSNSLVVSGDPADLTAAAAIIEKLDSGTELRDRQLRIVPVRNGEPADLASKLRQLYLDQVRNQPGAGAADALILPDAASGRLILAASENQLAMLQGILAQLDQTGAEDGRQLAIRSLRNHSAASLVAIISQFFERHVNSPDPSQRLVVTAGPNDRTLILEAPEPILAKVNELADSIESTESESAIQLRSYQLTESRAEDLAPTLASLFSERSPGDEDQPRFEADAAANILLVAAREDQFAEITKLIEELKATARVSSEVRTFTLVNSAAEDIAPILASMLHAEDPEVRSWRRRQPWRASSDPSTVNVAAAPAVNAVVVQGPPATLDAAERIIRSLDNPEGAVESVIHTVRLEKAQAEDVADAVNNALESSSRGPSQRATVTPVANSNSLLIDGPAESVQEVLKLVRELDAESTAGDIQIRVYKLENGRARELSRLLEQTLENIVRQFYRRGGGRRGARDTPVTITADERSNSLIISANPEQFENIEQLLATLDQNAGQPSRTVRFVMLENANALTVADQLDLLFSDRRPDERPVIEPDTFANSLTLIGSRSDIAEIERVIAELDQVSREESIQLRMLVIDVMPAEQLAEMLQGLYSQMSNSEIELVEKLEPLPPGITNQPPAKTADGKTLITIAVDRPSNALLMSGPAHELDAINKLIDDLTWSALGTEAEFRQFPLQEADPVAVARVLTELFKPEPIRVPREGGGQPQVVTPAARMTIVPEPRTRSLIVRGKAADFILLEQLLEQLDVQGVSAELTPRLIALEHAQPDEVLPLVDEMVEQLTEARPGEPVSIAADPRTRSILVIARDTVLAELEAFIKTLDTPPAFAEAQVAMIPLKNAVASDLADILQDMIRPGDGGEATPEMRALQEQIQSLKITDDQGREIRLDLSQPIEIMADSDRANRLIISSTPDNLQALTAIVEMMDTVAVAEGVTFRIIQVQNADAQSVAETLNTIFQQAQELSDGPAGPALPDSETGRALAGPLNIASDRRSNTLILSGTPEAITLAQRLLRDLDQEFEGFITQVRLFRLKYASAVRLAPLLQAVFAESGPVPGTEGLSAQVTRLQTLIDTNAVEEPLITFVPKTRAALTITAENTSNTLIVAARADVMPLIQDVIQSMDIPAASGMETVRIYPLENADASRLQRVITEIYAARGSQIRPEERPGISVDNRTNALIVTGNEQIFAFVETLISQLDKDIPFGYGEFRVIPLENADAITTANTLQQIIDTRAQQQAALSSLPVQTLRAIIIGDPRTNSLIVGGSNDLFDLVEALARELDAPGLALSGKIRLIPLEHASAGTISSALNTLFSQRYQGIRDRGRTRPIIIPDPRINALLVSASVEDNRALDELLKQLDRKLEDPALSIAVIGLEHNDSATVGNMIQTVFNGRLEAMTPPGSSPNPQDRVVISSDPLSNALIVVANKENLSMIEGLVERVDREPDVEGGFIQIIPLEKADASRVASMLRNLVSQGLYRPGMMSARGPAARSREALAIAVDPRSNTLIVSASPENMAVIKEVIERIDNIDYSLEGDIRLFQLQHARASQLAQTLLQFFQSKRAGEMQGREMDRSLPVTILADDRTNTLLVTGGREAFEAIERMLAQLDTEDAYDKLTFRVFPLANSTAAKLQTTLNQLFQNRPSRSGRPSEPITIVADSWANALIVGAAVEDMSMVANLIQTLDATQPQDGMQVRVIPVHKGDARALAETIQGLYETPGSPPAVRVDVDERINALVVSAGDADMERIVELVEKLDTDHVAKVSEIRIFPLQYAQAEELAQVLTLALTGRPDPTGATQSLQQQSMLQFIARTPEGEELVASALKESLLITADRRRNALVVSAPVDSMNLIASLINSLDSQSPQLAKIKVFQLQNADARQMAAVLTSLFRLREQQPGVPSNQRAIQYTLVRDQIAPGLVAEGEPFTATIGSAEQYALTVTIDLRTNSLLLGGTEHYVGLASHIIEQLDSTPAQERRTEVYRLKNSQATNVVTALQSFIEQERERLTAVASQADASTNVISSVIGNLQQQFAREVAIVAEPFSNALLLSASPLYFDRFKELIEQLDQPQSQVLIQVILAEVTLDQSRELGVEWAVQTRDGNTTIQTGTDFGIQPELQQFGGFSSAITGSDVSFLLRALEADGRLEVLSRPQILTADNQQANIDIGQRIPLITDTRVTDEGAVFNSYVYENVGVSLTVTPRISPNGSVQMEVAPEISQLTSSEVQISPGVTVPIISERTATTTVSVQNGQSVIIGGLISTTDDTRQRKVPFLGSIPYLGFLFRSSEAVSNRKELLIILTPQLLLTPEDARDLTQTQLQSTTIKDEIKRDKLQHEILEPLIPLFDKPQPDLTNGVPAEIF